MRKKNKSWVAFSESIGFSYTTDEKYIYELLLLGHSDKKMADVLYVIGIMNLKDRQRVRTIELSDEQAATKYLLNAYLAWKDEQRLSPRIRIRREQYPLVPPCDGMNGRYHPILDSVRTRRIDALVALKDEPFFWDGKPVRMDDYSSVGEGIPREEFEVGLAGLVGPFAYGQITTRQAVEARLINSRSQRRLTGDIE